MRMHFVCGLLVAAFPGVSLGQFNQWRGSERNGVAASGPALSAAWPQGGPAKLWESEKGPPEKGGGYGCVSVEAGRAYVYRNWKEIIPIPTRTLSQAGLTRLGWSDLEVPAELSKAVEQARTGEARAAVDAKDLRDWIQKWIAEHLPTKDQARKFGPYVADRLNRGKAAFPLEVLAQLARIKDRQFASAEALDKWLAENAIDGALKKAVLAAVPTTITKGWDVVFCFDAESSKPLWQFRREANPEGHGASGTPAIVGGRCYLVGSLGEVYCLDAATGKEVWKTAVAKTLVHSSVLVSDGVVVVQAGEMTGLDAASGAELWRQKKAPGSNSSPVAWSGGGRTLAICHTEMLVAVDVKTGELLWTLPGRGYSTAAVAGDYLVAFTNHDKVGLAAYRLTGAGAPEQLWAKPEFKDQGASPLIHEGHVYAVGTGRAVCVELASGKVAWDEKIKHYGYTSPVVADGKIFGIVDRQLWAIRATPAKYEFLAKAALPVSQYTSPTIAAGRLYLRLNDGVACYDMRASPPTSTAP